MILFKKIAESGKYHDDLAIHDVLTYITRKDKTPSRNIYYSHESMPHIIDSMSSIIHRYTSNYVVNVKYHPNPNSPHE